MFAFRSPDNTSLIPFFSYTEGTTYSVDILADYSTGTLNAFVDGALMLSNYAFWTAGAANVVTNELFFHLNGEAGGFSNSVALDNINAAAEVPEPAAPLIWSTLIAFAALSTRSRRPL